MQFHWPELESQSGPADSIPVYCIHIYALSFTALVLVSLSEPNVSQTPLSVKFTRALTLLRHEA